MRRCAGRGEEGELGEKRKWMFRFAEARAEEERRFALVSVSVLTLDDGGAIGSVGRPLEGDMVLCLLPVMCWRVEEQNGVCFE